MSTERPPPPGAHACAAPGCGAVACYGQDCWTPFEKWWCPDHVPPGFLPGTEAPKPAVTEKPAVTDKPRPPQGDLFGGRG